MEARRRRNFGDVEMYYGDNKLVQTAILYASLIGMLVTGAKTFFFTGNDIGEAKQEMSNMKVQLERGETEWARSKEVDLKLAMMDKHLDNTDVILKELSVKLEAQNHILDQIEVKMEMQKKPSNAN